MRTQRRRIDRPPSRRNHVADKLRAARAIHARNNRSLRYAPIPKQRSLDLPRLNPETAEFDRAIDFGFDRGRADGVLQPPCVWERTDAAVSTESDDLRLGASVSVGVATAGS